MSSRSLLMLLAGTAGALLVSCSLLITQDNCLDDTGCAPGFSCNVDVGLCRDLSAGPDCTEFIGAWEDPDAVLLGFIAPLSGDNTESGLFLRRAVELAVEEIQRVGGIGGAQEGRPLAVLLCDDRGDPEVGVRAARHLVEVAHVPAIVGAAFSRVTTRIAEHKKLNFELVSIDADVVFDRRGVVLAEEIDVPFPEITLTLTVKTDATPEQLKEVQEMLPIFCPVSRVFQAAGTKITEVWNVVD